MREKTQKQFLGEILRLEAKEAYWGKKASLARRDYAEKFAPFKVGDKVYYKYFQTSFKCGIIKFVGYDVHNGFEYTIKPLNKGFKPTKDIRAYIFIKESSISSGDPYYNIKKA